MRQSRTLDLGVEVHQESMAVASVAHDHDAAVLSLGTIGTRPCDLDQLVRPMPSKAHQLIFVGEAGPGGDWLDRDVRRQGADCRVVAPSLTPQQPGDRVNTDRRDAVPRARRARPGDRTAGAVPPGDDDARRALSRAREATIGALHSATVRLKAFWLRHEIRDTGRATWGPAHLRRLSGGVCPPPAQPRVLQAYGRAVTDPPERLQRLAPALHAQVPSWRLPPVVAALQARRGVPRTGAVTMAAESGDLPRLDTPRELMPCWGLTPSEESSGAQRRPGSRTGAGNAQARSALVAGAWAYRDPATGSRPLQRRLATPPRGIPDLRWDAQVRRCQRDRRLVSRGPPPSVVTVAMARELAGFMWATAPRVPGTPSHQP